MIIFSFFLSLILIGCSGEQQMPQKVENRIVFFGDSITELGIKPNGYISIIKDSLSSLGPHFEIIGAGIGGNKVTDLQNRVTNDVLAKKPDIVVIYIGINDVWHYAFASRGLSGTTKWVYERELRSLIKKVHAASARVILCTPSVIGEKIDGTNEYDTMLDEYSDISRSVASETGSALCDLRKTFVQYLKANNPANAEKNILTYDGVHLNDAGNRFVAQQIIDVLDGLGLFFPQR